MSTHIKPSLCVINYNGERILGDSLGAAVALKDDFAEILVVDNASEDGSLELIRSRFAEVRVVPLDYNGGPGVARNAGIDNAISDRVILIDNDVRLMPGCAERLVSALDEYPAAALAMPRILYAHKPDFINFDGADSHYMGLQTVEGENVPIAEATRDTRKIGSIITSCFIVDRARLGDAVRFDESMFIYLEDHDFGHRTRAMGHEILSLPDATCLHGQGTEGLSLRSLGKYSSKRVFCLIRNRWLFILKNYSAKSLVLFAPILIVYEIAQFGIVIKKGWLGEWGRSVYWIASNLPEILRNRREVQTRRAVPDSALLIDGPIPFRQELTESALERAAKRTLDAMVSGYWKLVRHLV